MFPARDYETIAASQTAQVLGPTGNKGDILKRLVIVTSAQTHGAVSIKDGSGNAISILVAGESETSDIVPIVVDLDIISVNGAWSVTTGVAVTVIAVGRFS